MGRESSCGKLTPGRRHNKGDFSQIGLSAEHAILLHRETRQSGFGPLTVLVRNFGLPMTIDPANIQKPIKTLTNRRTIRKKLLIGTIVLGIVVAFLGYGGFRGVYAYRDLAATLSHRAAEFPLTAELTRQVDDLRFSFRLLHNENNNPLELYPPRNLWAERYQYRVALHSARELLTRYQMRLISNETENPYLADSSEEKEMVKSIQRTLDRIANRYRGDELVLDATTASVQAEELTELSEAVHLLPTLLQDRMASFRAEVRSQYRIWIGLTWTSFAVAASLLTCLIVYARVAVIRPFKRLLEGARLVAAGHFEHKIEIDSEDEIAELASVINRGTEKFLRIQSDLNIEVMQRSREVIRNEQLASVGFLAAGVAHEINNPLASIAWSAEALESRLHNILHPIAESNSMELPELHTLKTYLRRIQDDAFRCKGITEKLLDFSRLSQAERKQPTDMADVVSDVIELVRHLSQYRDRKIEFVHRDNPVAWASPQEMKQVVLNLLTNSLDAVLDDQLDQRVVLTLHADAEWVYLSIDDNGCGMTEEVRDHLFEPFFTRRRDGRGTGLGLPITSRIIADHGGRITANSRGVNLGSKFEVLIPTLRAQSENESKQEITAAAA